MKNNRDDFTKKTKDILAKRVAYKCSNPNCKKPTIGSNSNPAKALNTGIAAHICAAASGGSRYDKTMTVEQRKDISNGIWLCSVCAQLIDKDIKYTTQIIHSWKENAEKLVSAEMMSDEMASLVKDKKILEFYASCFNRSAFRDPMRCEGNIEDDFKKAIDDTLVALNTGVLRSRDGRDIIKCSPQFKITNPQWRDKIEKITSMLEALLRKLDEAIKEKHFTQQPNGFYYFSGASGRDLEYWFDSKKSEIMDTLASVCLEASISIEKCPRHNQYRN